MLPWAHLQTGSLGLLNGPRAVEPAILVADGAQPLPVGKGVTAKVGEVASVWIDIILSGLCGGGGGSSKQCTCPHGAHSLEGEASSHVRLPW